MKGAHSNPGLHYEALVRLLRTSEALWNASRVFFTKWELSPSQFNVLNLLAGQPDGCSQVELSRQLIMHRSNVTGLVDRLEARGLLQRRERATDRRVFNVRLTRAGEKLIRQILPAFHQAAEAVWGETSAERARELTAELAIVSANAERIAGEAGKRRRSGKSGNERGATTNG